VLRAFAEANRIGYPMLSDVGSKVIAAFGILNTNIPQDHPRMYGIPFPGDYLIAPGGTVRDKLFIPDYQFRVSASEIVVRNFGASRTANSAAISANPIEGKISLSASRCFSAEEVAVVIELRVKQGWHIYGSPLPANYQGLEVVFASPIIGEQAIEFPPARPMRLEALGETLPVYEGEIRAIGRLRVKWSPAKDAKFLHALAQPIEPGQYRIAGTLKFQACSDSVCEAPREVNFELPLTLEAGIPTAGTGKPA
jgi:AhpC/TSA family/Disulphide bond corrector protein DsbC